MTTDAEIRAGRPSDAPAIARVHVASWRSGYRGLLPDELLDGLSVEEREAAWHERLTDVEAQRSGRRVNVAVRGGSLLGFVAAGPSREEDRSATQGEVYAIYVDPDSWSAGVGQALLASAVAHLVALGATEALLWVLASNARARAFYELAGWRGDGRARTRTLRDSADVLVWVEEACYRRALP